MSKVILTIAIVLVLALIAIFVWPKPFEDMPDPEDNAATPIYSSESALEASTSGSYEINI